MANSGGLIRSAAELAWSWSQEHPAVRGWIVRIFKRPRLVLSFPLTTDGWCNQLVDYESPTETKQLSRVIRVKVENTGRSHANGCRVYIDTVTVHGQEAIARDLSNVLSWKDREGFDSVSLPPKIPAYVNVCFARADAAALTFATMAGYRGATTMEGYRGAHTYQTDGEYEVHIRAEGENFVSPGDIVLRIAFTRSSPLNVRVELISARGDTRIA